MKNILTVVIIITVFANSFCENVVGFDFLNLPISARSAGMANIGLIGENPDALSVRTNPAMLSGLKKNALSIDFAPVILDIYTGAISGAIVSRNGMVISPSISYISFGTLDARDENGDEMNLKLTPFGLSVDCAVSYKWFERLGSGIRLKFVHERLTGKTAFWDDAYSGAIGMDFGIFSDFKILRYSAGFRNVGFPFDGYEYLDVKLPASAFAALGVIWEKEAKIEWYLECERFFYDYLFFRTGFEVPVFRDILEFRFGTVFSPNDAKNLFKSFGSNAAKSWEYSSETWILATIGATIKAKSLSLDIACQFRKDGIRPGLLFSGTYYF